MKKEYRVKKTEEIKEILDEKNSFSNKYFAMYKKKNLKTTHFRYAISVGKKLGKAIVRNRIKRQVTSIIDKSNINLDNNVDIFIIVRANVLNIQYDEMFKELNYLFSKHKLIKEKPNE